MKQHVEMPTSEDLKFVDSFFCILTPFQISMNKPFYNVSPKPTSPWQQYNVSCFKDYSD